MLFKRVCIEGFGVELPPIVLSSAEIERRLEPLYRKLKLPEGRLELMSGIRERRLWEPGTRPSQGSARAGAKALAASGVDAAQMDCLLHTSVSRDYMEPASASFVHRSLGLPADAVIYDLSNACLGFMNGMLTLANMIELGQVERGLIVAGECSRTLVESTIEGLLNHPNPTRDNIKGAFASLTIGSGACAVVLAHERASKTGRQLLGGVVRSATEWSELCRGNYDSMETDSEKLLHAGCTLAKETWGKFTGLLGWTGGSVSRFFCHQVGSAHRKLLYSTLGLDLAKDFSTVETLGNTGSAALPITMAQGLAARPLQSGETCALLGIGSGLNCVMLGVKA